MGLSVEHGSLVSDLDGFYFFESDRLMCSQRMTSERLLW